MSPIHTQDWAEAKSPVTQHQRSMSMIAFIDPRLQHDIMLGRQPPEVAITAARTQDLPWAWADQAAALRNGAATCRP